MDGGGEGGGEEGERGREREREGEGEGERKRRQLHTHIVGQTCGSCRKVDSQLTHVRNLSGSVFLRISDQCQAWLTTLTEHIQIFSTLEILLTTSR